VIRKHDAGDYKAMHDTGDLKVIPAPHKDVAIKVRGIISKTFQGRAAPAHSPNFEIESDKAPTNKIYRRVSSEQRPRTRSCRESERPQLLANWIGKKTFQKVRLT